MPLGPLPQPVDDLVWRVLDGEVHGHGSKSAPKSNLSIWPRDAGAARVGRWAGGVCHRFHVRGDVSGLAARALAIDGRFSSEQGLDLGRHPVGG